MASMERTQEGMIKRWLIADMPFSGDTSISISTLTGGVAAIYHHGTYSQVTLCGKEIDKAIIALCEIRGHSIPIELQ